jgi:hypothetical protein
LYGPAGSANLTGKTRRDHGVTRLGVQLIAVQIVHPLVDCDRVAGWVLARQHPAVSLVASGLARSRPPGQAAACLRCT